MMTPGLRGLLASLAVALLLIGCGGDGQRAQTAATPRAYHPEHFPDIPLPPGYQLTPGHDQLAVAMAGGVVRRFDVCMVAKANQPEVMRPAALLGWYAERLPALGWTAVQADAGEQRYRRSWPEGVGEELTITAAGSLAGPTVEFHLAPWSPPAEPAKP